MKKHSQYRGFTLLELQVAIVLLAFGVVTLASLMATQSRLLKHLQKGYAADATIHVARTKDPWVKELNTPARVATSDFTETAPTPVSNPNNTVTIVTQETDLKAESITVTADLTPIP